MTPYYQSEGVTIYHGDCREVLPTLGPTGVIVTDPPYGDTALEWDKTVSGWMTCCTAANSLWCFGSLRMLMEMARRGETAGWKYAQEIVWEKNKGSGFAADRFKRVHELAVQFYRGEWAQVFKQPVMTTGHQRLRVTMPTNFHAHIGKMSPAVYTSEGERLMTSVIHVKSCYGSEHPTQKPIGIIDPLLRYSVPPGGLVTDPFMGSGSTLVAARALGLTCTGIEIDEQYCEVAAKRLSQAVLPLSSVPSACTATTYTNDGGVFR